MSNPEHKPGGKSDRRKQKRKKKAEQKAGQPQSPAVELMQAASEPVEAAVTAEAPKAAVESVAAPEATPAKPVERVASFRERMAAVTPPAPASPPAPVEVKAVPSPAAAPAASIQAIANAYRDYTKQSLEDAQSFAEKLTAARSFDKAAEAQTEFARQACETFADNSRKIRELHRELFWQTFRLPNWPAGRPQR